MVTRGAGLSTPPLLLLIIMMTNNKKTMGDHVNSRAMNVLSSTTTTAISLASLGLVATWFT